MKLKDVAKVCPHSERSLKRWKQAYVTFGMEGLIPKSTKPKTQPNETPIRIKERIIDKRKDTKLCAKKIHWKLEKEGLFVPISTVAKILKDAGLVRKYRMKKIKYKHIKVTRLPGELVEIDVKHVPGPIKGHKYQQYTAIDTASRWRHLEIFDEESTFHSIEFLRIVMDKFPHQIKAIKTDNHSTFTNYYLGTNKRSDMTVKTIHSLDIFCGQNNIIHYLIDPGKPTQNGTIERSHGEDQRKFYEQNKFRSAVDLKKKIRLWNDYYNNLEHCSLNGKTPNEMLG
ncbi:MAG: transposase InsO family protein [Candidatus Azotimanducaceae bacterium]|jgi:transposase InsO family protein